MESGATFYCLKEDRSYPYSTNMSSWLVYIIVAMFFGSLSIVLAKAGLSGSSEFAALFVRTGILFSITCMTCILSQDLKKVLHLDRRTLLILIATGIATSIYWIFYYKALKTAQASHVAAIDKAGIIITVLLSAVFLNEPVSVRSLLGTALIIAGCLLVILSK